MWGWGDAGRVMVRPESGVRIVASEVVREGGCVSDGPSWGCETPCGGVTVEKEEEEEDCGKRRGRRGIGRKRMRGREGRGGGLVGRRRRVIHHSWNAACNLHHI